MKKNYWLWYPGDFERYHAMKQNFSRVERGYEWPAFWKSEGFRNRIVFRRTYTLQEETSFCVHSNSIGFVLAGEKKYPFEEKIYCSPGPISITVHAACVETFPCIYIEGEIICSDEGWMTEDFSEPPVEAGHNKYFTRIEQNPQKWEYEEQIYYPIQKQACNGGVLFEFETELTAILEVKTEIDLSTVRVYCGESRQEALDTIHCYYS